MKGKKMKYNIHDDFPEWNFEIKGASYAGRPEDGTMMYISKKVGHLLENLNGHVDCLCFIQRGIDIPEDVSQFDNAIITVENPQYEYAKFATKFQMAERKKDIEKGYSFTEGGYYIGDNVQIGENAYIEPGVLIGHDVIIGDNAVIMSGAVIKHSIIGSDFICNENAVIGDYSFTMAEDDNGNKFRIPALGKIIIHDHVEVGACDDIAIGACGNTVLDDYVKLDGLVYVGHEVHLGENTEITAGVIVAGFVTIGVHSYLGVNSSIRNRIDLGDYCVIGMGATVTKHVDAGITVIGNPARKHENI